jgi:predicted transcriptional regulator
MKIRIVESISEYNKKLHEMINKDLITKPITGMIMTPETFSKVFSPERIKLLQRIYHNNVKNIYQLAKELEKPYEVVFRNIKYLEGIGLVKITDKNNKKIPCLADRPSIDMLGLEA